MDEITKQAFFEHLLGQMIKKARGVTIVEPRAEDQSSRPVKVIVKVQGPNPIVCVVCWKQSVI